MAKVIRVKFSQMAGSEMHVNENARNLSTREYDYFLVDDKVEASKGSLAVVDVSGILRIVVIVGVMAASSKATKHAICVFNLDEHKALVQKSEEIAGLRELIAQRAKEASYRKELADLAEHDDGLKAMLEELKQLEG